MRTTLTLDDDVAAMLGRVQKARKATLKDVVNEALREGLKQMSAPPVRRRSYRTPSSDLGPCLIGNIDNIAEALEVAEGPSNR
jgi:hypothetical protein